LLKKDFPTTTMQFWGDIIIHRPDLIPLLPKDVIALEWGYEGDHPFSTNAKHFAKAGIPFFVCPGTSSWNSIGGRITNCYQNLKNASENGVANGALGYLVTDWGDHGHWQQLPISFFGFIAGSEFCWNAKAHKNDALDLGCVRLAELLDLYTFSDKSRLTGQLLLVLGNAYLHAEPLIGNQSPIWRFLMFYGEYPRFERGKRPSDEHLQKAEKILRTAKSEYIGKSQIGREDREVILEELEFTCDLLIFACKFGATYVQHTWNQGKEDVPVAQLPEKAKRELRAELEPLLKRFDKCWLVRNRPGGLKDSVGRLKHVQELLQ